MRPTSEIIVGDCREELGRLARPANLVFADPPYNLGVDYGNGAKADRRPSFEYIAWIVDWMSCVHYALRQHGSFFLAIDNFYVSGGVHAGEIQGFSFRQIIIWRYNFGNHCETKFGRDHTPLIYFTKHPKRFTFNADAVRVPSLRQTKYNDKRANPKGRVPGDVWHFPRVCGTFKARSKGHPTQMPVALVERVILACTNPGDLVVDPFCGSGTTGVAAKRTGRSFIGIEINREYAAMARQRIEAAGEPAKEKTNA